MSPVFAIIAFVLAGVLLLCALALRKRNRNQAIQCVCGAIAGVWVGLWILGVLVP